MPTPLTVSEPLNYNNQNLSLWENVKKYGGV